MRKLLLAVAGVATLELAVFADNSASPSMQAFPDPTGEVRTFSTLGAIDLRNPFFQSLGTNGRTCASCHQPSAGWTITPANVQARFDLDGGLDPIFSTNDGSNSPNADV